MKITRKLVKKINMAIKKFDDDEIPENKGLLRLENVNIEDERSSTFTLEMLRKVKIVKNTLYVMFRDTKIYNAVYLINLDKIHNMVFDPDCNEVISGKEVKEFENKRKTDNGTQIFS